MRPTWSGCCVSRKPSAAVKSRIASSVSVYNELLRRRPDLVDRLYEPFMMDTKGEGGVRYLPVRPCRFDDGRLRTFYHTDYFRSAVGFGGESMLPTEDRAVLDLYNEIADSPDMYLDMDLEPGDVQLLSNHTVLHARTDYEDYAEPELKRHLLRLWISLPSRAPPRNPSPDGAQPTRHGHHRRSPQGRARNSTRGQLIELI